MSNTVAVIIQARTGSSRLPGKVLAELAGRPSISFLVERLKRCIFVDHLILATTQSEEDDCLAELGEALDFGLYEEVRTMFYPATHLQQKKLMHAL